ncbi:hypothetical protein WN48_05712 [Eufriesea mexicana]|nr:hypothetical protein WN48_05712 [Eufriesea mexicana]
MYILRGSTDVITVYTPISNLYPSTRNGRCINSCTKDPVSVTFILLTFFTLMPR